MSENVEIKKDVVIKEEKMDFEKETQRLKAELEAIATEKEKLKSDFNKASSEAAEFKRREKERMSVEEQEKARVEEQEKAYKAVIVELNRTKAESVFAKKGWDEKDYGNILSSLAENTPPEKMVSIANEITMLVKVREDKVAELTKTALIKDTNTDLKGKDESNEDSDYARYVKSKKDAKIDEVVKFD